MRSRTSRGVPEWSRGEDLYMGSCNTVTGKFQGHTGIVPGPSKGVWGVPRVGPPIGERSNFKKIPTHTQDHGDA